MDVNQAAPVQPVGPGGGRGGGAGHAHEELAEARANEFRDAVVPALNRRGVMVEMEKLIHRLGHIEARPALILVHLANGDDIRRAHGLAVLDQALRLTCDVLGADSHQAAQGLFLEARTGVALLEPGMTAEAAITAADRNLR